MIFEWKFGKRENSVFCIIEESSTTTTMRNSNTQTHTHRCMWKEDYSSDSIQECNTRGTQTWYLLTITINDTHITQFVIKAALQICSKKENKEWIIHNIKIK